MKNDTIRIVAIDDNIDNLVTIDAIVKDALPNAVIKTAKQGLKGIELSRELKPDVILLDILMPGLSGYDTCKLIKQDPNLSTTPVLFLTALKSNRENRMRALDVGAQGFLTKPIDEVDLIAQVQTMKRLKRAQDREKNEKIRLAKLVREKTEELQKAFTDLKEKQEDYTRLFNNMISGVSLNSIVYKNNLPVDYRILNVNNAFEEMVQIPKKNIIGKVSSEVLADFKELNNYFPLFCRVASTGEPEEFEFMSGKHNRYFHVVSTCPIKGRFTNNFQDVTEKKHIEELQNHFINTVSHELRTPLTSIHQSINILKNDSVGVLNETQKNVLDITLRNAERLTLFVSDVLDFQKMRSESSELSSVPTEVKDVIQETIDTMKNLADEKGIELTSEVASDIPPVSFDRDKIQRLLLNLVSNAIKYTDEGKVVVKSTFNRDNRSLLFAISDTGIGIKQEDIKKLFLSFSKLNSSSKNAIRSTGLGLSICKEIVNLHKGKIWVESTFGKGSTFFVEIPK